MKWSHHGIFHEINVRNFKLLPEFVLIVKNNVQKPGGKNAAATAGKYMVASRGNLREMMFSTGIKFTEDFVMMANDYDMQIDEYPDKNVKS